MTWPVNWIEQAGRYEEIQKELASLQAQSQTVTVPSFTEPSQQMWEDAYSAQVGQSGMIQPGTRLIWFDLKNGIPKRYTTVYSSDTISIDPLVRPFVSETEGRSSFRFLGARQMYTKSQFNPINAPIRHRDYSLLFDLGMPIRKNLIALEIHFAQYSTVYMSLYGNTPTEEYWGNNSESISWVMERAAATVTSTAHNILTSSGYSRLAGPDSTTTTTTEIQHGYATLFGPSAPFLNGEQQPFSAGVNYIALSGALTAQATPLRLFNSGGSKYDASGIKELYFGTPSNRGLNSEHGYLYGLFAGNPGPLEVFDV